MAKRKRKTKPKGVKPTKPRAKRKKPLNPGAHGHIRILGRMEGSVAQGRGDR